MSMTDERANTPSHPPVRYDLLAVNLAMALIAALLLAGVGSRVELVSILDQTEIAGQEVSLAVGAAVNPGVITAAVAILFATAGALLCAGHNRVRGLGPTSVLTAFFSWLFTGVALVFFAATLMLTPLSLAVQVGV